MNKLTQIGMAVVIVIVGLLLYLTVTKPHDIPPPPAKQIDRQEFERMLKRGQYLVEQKFTVGALPWDLECENEELRHRIGVYLADHPTGK